jgi:ABC-type multidrug transport system fused ATPase/permease subunit
MFTAITNIFSGFVGKFKVYLIFAGILAVMSGAGYWYYNHSQAEILALQKSNTQLEMAVKDQLATIASMKAFAAQQAQDLLLLQSNLASSESDKSKLSELLAKHDLTALARSKPKLIEQRINDASKKALKDLSRSKP